MSRYELVALDTQGKRLPLSEEGTFPRTKGDARKTIKLLKHMAKPGTVFMWARNIGLVDNKTRMVTDRWYYNYRNGRWRKLDPYRTHQ